MTKGPWTIASAVLCSMALSAVSLPASAQTQANPPAAQAATTQKDALRARAQAYYHAAMRGDQAVLKEILAPESKDAVTEVDLRTMAAFTIDDVTIAPSGDTAVVTTTRTFLAPMAMTMPWKDNWKQIDGQWYMALPPRTYETPFGVVKPSATPDDKAMQAIVEHQTRQVDPDQVMKQLAKFQEQQEEQQRAQAAAKAKAEADAKQAAACDAAIKSKNKKKKAENCPAVSKSAGKTSSKTTTAQNSTPATQP